LGLFASGTFVIWAAIGCIGVLALVALALWVPYRGLRRALAEDHAGLVALVEDGVMRRPLRRLDCRLAETDLVQEGLFPLLGRIGTQGTPMDGPSEPAAQSLGLESPDHPFAPGAVEPGSPPAGGGGVIDDRAGQPAVPQRTPTPPPARTGRSGLADLTAPVGDLHSEIFRAYDIRGVVGQGIDEEVMRDIGHAVGSEAADLGNRSVIVARDTRASSGALAAALITGLRASGRDVFDLGIAPTPLLYFATRYRHDTSGVMVTASHNPLEYNGCKVVLGGQSIEGDRLQVIARRIQRRGLVELPTGAYQKQDLTVDYIGHVERDVTVARRLKVVVDGGNGAAALLAPALYRTLGCEVIEFHCDLDGGFPNGQVPDPSRADNVRELSGVVTTAGAELGLAFDGDGDRLGVVDSNGRFIAMDRVLMLFAADVLSRHPGTDVIYDVKCTHLLAAEIIRSGGRPVMWQSGHSRLKAKLRATGALLAGELSGHVIFQERWFGFDDAIYAGARLLELLALDPRRSADVFATLPDAVGTPELLLPLKEGEPQRMVAQILELADRLDGVTIKTIDGLRAEFDRGWGLVRASNTQPALSFRFQGDDQEALDMIQGLFRRLMERVAPGLALPF
jgi:phosphomannomutase/phosphoglucomutase